MIKFDEVHEGYWTGDCECSCFNPISQRNEFEADRFAWYDACTYIRLRELDPNKRYRVTLRVEAEEID